jgi:hypothetical protein
MMSPVTIRAHFDGQHIRVDEPRQLEPDAQLLIVVLPKQPDAGERADWTRLSQQALEHAYAEDEPDYALDAIKKPNPDYERR